MKKVNFPMTGLGAIRAQQLAGIKPEVFTIRQLGTGTAGSGVLTVSYEGVPSYTYTNARVLSAGEEVPLIKITGAGALEYAIVNFISTAHNLRDLRFTINNDDKKMELSVYEAYMISQKRGDRYGFVIHRFFEDVTWFNPNVSFTSTRCRCIYSIQIPAQRFNKSFEFSVKNHYSDEVLAQFYSFYTVLPTSFGMLEMKQVGDAFYQLTDNLEKILDAIKRLPKELLISTGTKERITTEELRRITTEELRKITTEELKRRILEEMTTEELQKILEERRKIEEQVAPEKAEAAEVEVKEEKVEEKRPSLKEFLPWLALAAAMLGTEKTPGGGEGA